MKSYLLPLLLLCAAPLCAQPVLPKAANFEESLKKARVGGKYAMLLAQIEVPDDRAKYGDFADNGFSATPEWGGFKDLPAGYWVYVAPYWYIWRDAVPNRRPWGPEQVTGEPDTTEVGDRQTAWASRSQDDQPEWLLAEFPTPINATAVKVCETYNPGAISRITAFGLDGKETEIWAGQAAPNPDGAVVVNQKAFPHPLKTNRVKIYLDSPKVPGWNEIDAIGLLDKDGKTQWASAVACSSTYAEQNREIALPGGGFVPAVPDADRLQQLEQQLRQMQTDINELRQRAGLPPRPITIAPPNVDFFFGGHNARGLGANRYQVQPGEVLDEKNVTVLHMAPAEPVIIEDVPGFAPAPVPEKPR